MIKINLATRKQSASATGTAIGPTGIANLFKFNSVVDGMKDLPVREIALYVVMGTVGYFVADEFKVDQLKEATDQVTKVDEEKKKLQGEIVKLKGLDAVKAALEGDETVIRTKIETIQKLIAGRQIPPKILTTLSSGIPQEVWLSDLRIQESEVSIKGSSYGFNQISDFMKNLSDSAYFKDLKLLGTQQNKDSTGVNLATFVIVAKRR